jgi:cytochrome c oxidase cbb3-type subunit 4
MDALVAYLQMLGTLVDFSVYEARRKLPVGADMELDYHSMRAFADSWGLVYMFAIFVAVVVWTLRPGSQEIISDDAARIPFKED